MKRVVVITVTMLAEQTSDYELNDGDMKKGASEAVYNAIRAAENEGFSHEFHSDMSMTVLGVAAGITLNPGDARLRV